MDPEIDPKWTPNWSKIDRFWDLKTVPKINIFGPQNEPKIEYKIKKT